MAFQFLRIDAFVRSMDEAGRFLHPDQHYLCIRTGVASRYWQARSNHPGRRWLFCIHRPPPSLHASPNTPVRLWLFRMACRRLPAQNLTGRSRVLPTLGERSVRPQPSCVSMPGGTRMLIRADASACTVFAASSTRGQSIPRIVIETRDHTMLEMSPSPTSSTPSSTRASVRNCSVAIFDAAPRPTVVEAGDRYVAFIIVQRGKHLDQSH